MISKCLPTLLYGLEACPLKSADLKSLDYIVVGAFMKIFKTKLKEVASCCMEIFNCPLPSVSVNNRKCKFLQKFSAFENIIYVVIVLIALSSVLMFYAAD